MKNQIKRVVAMIIIIALMFIDYGMSFQAIATEGGNFLTSLFKRDSLNMDAYIGEGKSEATVNVNDTVTVYLDMSPNIEGYLKSGEIDFRLRNSESKNFKIKSVELIEPEREEEPEEIEQEVVEEPQQEIVEEVTTEEIIEEESEEVVQEDTSEEEIIEEVESEEVLPEENLEEELNEESEFNEQLETFEESEINEEESQEELNMEGTTINNLEPVGTQMEESATVDSISAARGEIMVDAELLAEQTLEEENAEFVAEDAELISEQAVAEENTHLDYYEIIKELLKNVKLDEENKIQVQDLYKDTKIKVELEYLKDEKVDLQNLASLIDIDFSGIFINVDLEEEAIVLNKSIQLNWEYDKDIEVESNYIKVAPFTMGDSKGTIVENEIIIRREIEEENFLPIKDTEIKIYLPELNGKLPTQVNIIAEQLMLTHGEGSNEVTFNEDNWNYDENSQTISVKVENTDDKYYTGEDKYLVTYRYDVYADGEEASLRNKVEFKATEESYKNKVLEKTIDKTDSIVLITGELITYSLNSDTEILNRGLVNANYYSSNEYRAEFNDVINLNILTSDLLDNVIIKTTGEEYTTKQGVVNDAGTDVKIAGIKLNVNDLRDLLSSTTIDLLNQNNEVIYTVTNENIGEGQILFEDQPTDISIRFNDINTNINTQIEIERYISKSSYIQSEFVTFKTVSTKIQALVKYTNFENIFTLQEVENIKTFEDSSTVANIYMNSDALLTTKNNENVEIRIELNNDKETSDFYQNPSFEIVYPSYIKSINIKNVSVLNASGLKLDKVNTESSNGIYKTTIDLVGIQSEFSDAVYSNGTNIVINADIDVDDITPRKKDEIKLYYTNEAVTNYESQTTWKISKVRPAGIIKLTNGFDGVTFTYNAPQGMILVNGIYNYNGNYDNIESIKQGEVSAQISRENKAYNATMNIDLLNNTGNEATDLVILGRIPFKGNTDVINGVDLGTNIDTHITKLIVNNNENGNIKIYYSENEKATKDLEDEHNEWNENPSDLTKIKSYLIVFENTVGIGEQYSFSYDFEIPEDLPYEAKIQGAAGVFYNNEGSILTSYETSNADQVVLITESGPKLEAIITAVGLSDGDVVGEGQFIEYEIKVSNVGSFVAKNVLTRVKVPENGIYYYYTEEDLGMGNNNYVPDENNSEYIVDYVEKELLPGRNITYRFLVKVGMIGNDQNDEIISVQGSVSTDILANSIQSNKLSFKIAHRSFDFQINSYALGSAIVGRIVGYQVSCKNINSNDLENVIAQFFVPDGFTYKSVNINGDYGFEYDEDSIEFDETTRILSVRINKLPTNAYYTMNVETMLNKKVSDDYAEAYARAMLPNGYYEESSHNKLLIYGSRFEVTQRVNKTSISEGEEVQFIINIKNIGNYDSKDVIFIDELPEFIEGYNVTYTGVSNSTVNVENNKINVVLPSMGKNDELTVVIRGFGAELGNGVNDRVVYNQAIVTGDFVVETKSNISQVQVLNKEGFVSSYNRTSSNDNGVKSIDNFASAVNNGNNSNPSQTNSSTSTDSRTSTSSQGGTSTRNSSTSATTNGGTNSNANASTNTNANSNSNSDSNTHTHDHSNEATLENNGVTYSISGYVWHDENNDGMYTAGEKYLNSIVVELYKGTEFINTYLTDGNGAYLFSGLTNGVYQVRFKYDQKVYTATIYKGKNTSDEFDSDAIEYEEYAATNTIRISNANVSNICLGLSERDIFDLQIGKYLTASRLETNKRTNNQTYDYKEISKIEVRSKELNSAKVTLEYTLVIENVGKIDGMATTIIDALPEGTRLSADDNNGWTSDDSEYIYNTTLANTVIKAGEKVELKVLLEKDMNSDNTGIVNNRAVIATGQNGSNIEDNNLDNNTGTNQVLITVSTGKEIQNIIIIVLLIIIAILAILLIITRKKLYKNSQSSFKELKKVYK